MLHHLIQELACRFGDRGAWTENSGDTQVKQASIVSFWYDSSQNDKNIGTTLGTQGIQELGDECGVSGSEGAYPHPMDIVFDGLSSRFFGSLE